MSTPPSASEDYSPRSSPTRSNTAQVPSYLPSQAACTSPARNNNLESGALELSYRQSQWKTMALLNNVEVSDYSETGLKHQQSTFALQPSALAPQSNQSQMHSDDAQIQDGAKASWQRSLAMHEGRTEEHGNPNQDLPWKDWERLEERYEQDMEAAKQHEQSIIDEIEWVMKMVKESTIASSRIESERAKKRLCTRVAYVQQSEEALAEKRVHYNGVLDAFQAAMALLGGV